MLGMSPIHVHPGSLMEYSYLPVVYFRFIQFVLCIIILSQQNHSEAENGRFTTSTFGRDRYALVPGQAPNNAAAPIDIEASFAWREIPRDRITLGKVLGEGEFGMVVRGELTEDDGNVITCAVKKLKRMSILFLLQFTAQSKCSPRRHRSHIKPIQFPTEKELRKVNRDMVTFSEIL